MADKANATASAGPSGQPAASAAKSAPKQNPAFRMLGMPNFRFRLPSRNWMIFLTITSSFTGALIYDRREKRRAQQKWCDLVAHLSKESLPIEQTRRKLTIFLAAPPGDGIRVAREYFQEYVKPVLVAAALDYNVVEGRREGDVRAGLAERIRKHRRKAGELSTVVEETGIEEVIADARQKIGVYDEPSPKGDLVIGRHTWKEYVRGLHEGWLGPLDPPVPSPVREEPLQPVDTPETAATEVDVASLTAESPEPKSEPEKVQEKPEEKKEEKPSKPTGPTPAYLASAEYPSQPLPPTLPHSFDGSVPIQFPHLLGFLNTPIRIYRYLTQRYLADSVGREVAAIVLASATRPYEEKINNDTNLTATLADSSSPSEDPSFTGPIATQQYEQHTILAHEEKEWHKSIYKQRDQELKDLDNENENGKRKEHEWLDDIVLDPRIATRMQRYILAAEEQARADRILSGQEYILGEVRPKHVPYWKRMWIKYGYGEDEEVAKRKSIIGNLDGED